MTTTGPPPPPPPPASSKTSVLDREKRSLRTHRDAIRGDSLYLSPPQPAKRGTFLHGFLLPFTLIIATLRHPQLGLSYLKLTVVRAIIVAICAYVVFGHAKPDERWNGTGPRPVVVRHDGKPVHVKAPGLNVDIDDQTGEKRVVVFGKEIPVVESQREAEGAAPEDTERAPKEEEPTLAPTTATERALYKLSNSWKWLVWFIGVVSATEAFIVFFSRRWDDWLSFHASSLARIRPEEEMPKPPKIAFDVVWLFRKLKRRIRGYLVFGAGIPIIALFFLIPGHLGPIAIGDAAFTIGITLWGWYWLAVFTAGKSAHAWIDVESAPSPLLIREIRDRSVGRWWLSPFRLYGRIWGWITKSMNAAAMTFERNPRPFLGLALARLILSLPGLYLLARPVVPIAAGRLCAESDPYDRISSP